MRKDDVVNGCVACLTACVQVCMHVSKVLYKDRSDGGIQHICMHTSGSAHVCGVALADMHIGSLFNATCSFNTTTQI